MYNFIADFKSHDDKKQPYSFYSEKNSHLKHSYGYVENGEYIINCTGGRNFVLTPNLKSFILNEECCIIKPMLNRFSWGFYFGYDHGTRTGSLVLMDYNKYSKEFVISLFDVNVNAKREIERFTYNNVVFEEDKYFPVILDVSEEYCKIDVNGIEAAFNYKSKPGMIALTKEEGGAGFKIKTLSISSNDEIKAEKLYSRSFELTRNEGNDYPYTVDLNISRYENGVKEIDFKLHGGVAFTVKLGPEIKLWSSAKDWLKNPYIRFIGDCDARKMYLRSGKLTFVDDVNVNSVKISEVNNADPTPKKESPFTKKYLLQDFDSFEYFVFGYDIFHRGSADFECDEAECIYGKDGKLVYYGEKLENRCIVKVRSEKFEIEALIRKSEFVRMDDAIEHVRGNHYFTVNETPKFTITVMSDEPSELIKVKARLTDVFFKEIHALDLKLVSECVNCFGKNERTFEAETEKLPQNVYHVVIECVCGEKCIAEHASAFDVIDTESNITPTESAGLPFIYVGDAHTSQPYPWSVKPDHNINHYVGTILAGPRQAEEIKMWELNKIYGKKQLVWFTQRTAGLETYKDHIDCVKNADYIYYLYPGIEESSNYYRYDHFHKSLFQAKKMRVFYNEFSALHPEYALGELPVEYEGRYDIGFDGYAKLEPIFDEWVDFVNPKIDKLFDEQWAEVLRVNPNVKRYSYGPFNAYATRAVGGEVLKYFGHPESVIAKRFDFVQYEDYTFCCNYPLAYSTWGMTTSRLLAPGLKIGPELYDSFEPGCPDGHVAFPAPPFSESYAPPYQTTSQYYGYAYNSVYHSKDGFKYWDDKMLQVFAAYCYEPKKRFNELLKSWKKYIDNQPASPKKTVCYLYKTSNKDNEFELEHEGTFRTVMQNKCAIAMTYLYTRLSELGIPAGFPTDSIEALTENDIDVLVIPSTYALADSEIAKVKELYNKGVKLIATGDVTGLEDIFGVKKHKRSVSVSRLYMGRKSENILPFEAEFLYDANGAQAILTEGEKATPVLLKTDKTLLINCSLGIVGAENFTYIHTAGGRENVSDLIKEAVNDSLISLTSPIVRAFGNAYANIFETKNGEDGLLIYQCSDYEKNPQYIRVKINGDSYSDVNAVGDEREINKIFNSGRLIGFEVTLNPRETMLFKLEK